MCYDFYAYTNDFADFDKAFKITKALMDSVDMEQLKGYNFNRYSEEGEDRRPHITIRLDLENTDQVARVIEKLSDMNSQGTIEDFQRKRFNLA